MSHFEERLEQDRDRLRGHVEEVTNMVELALHDSMKALLRRDHDLAARVILNDHPINRLTRRVDELCHLFVVRHLPTAGHLRFVSSIVRLMVALERIGDYAVTIARESVQLSEAIPEKLERDLEMIGDQSRGLFKRAMAEFLAIDANGARATKAAAAESKIVFQNVFADLVAEAREGGRPTEDVFALLIVHNRLARVRDQAKNICEETIFAATGETKAPKRYRILFADRANTLRSTLAEAIAKKNFPESGAYRSRGVSPADAPDTTVLSFLERRGHDTSGVRPRQLHLSEDDLNDYHVIVCLEDGVRRSITDVPFHTIVLDWRVGPSADDAAEMHGEEMLAALYDDLAVRVRELLTTLRGKDAS